ncbi:G-type lectin S-receptor-like serine/threonine-protein kinase SD2-2 [Citrus sinensis]|uniref:G-type lectin S-receptor-like serine/threonine-protein kinase SD2-2 n=1 Tax=Citrus sinensis TaxID=2711 RepID=A0ACB8MQ68_CITSI|nr:G-type lectin S-receptor-like serine/threonine-protein kinase SD2-2 [Citrus sinensis]
MSRRTSISSPSSSFMSATFLVLFLLLITAVLVTRVESKVQINPSFELAVSKKEAAAAELRRSNTRLEEKGRVIIKGNSTIISQNQTFRLGFFATNGESSWYLGIWYASIPTPTYVWVANREKSVADVTQSTLLITEKGKLAIKDSQNSIIWQSTNTEKATDMYLLETGNLVLLSSAGSLVWQSFDHPTDTWLPGMNISVGGSITSWKSLFDPSPGFYSLRLSPTGYNQIELVYNGTIVYWSTGNWTGNAFVNVPEMTIPYIYKFHFLNPYTSKASFGYTEKPLDNGQKPPLSRFHVDPSGQLKQYTWSQQTDYWNMFWSQPEDICRVHGLCGNFGFCKSSLLRPCMCFDGFRPVDCYGWNSGDYSGGCSRESKVLCDQSDWFEEVGVVEFIGAVTESFSAGRSICERSCLANCSCIGLYHDVRTNLCKNLYGELLNLRNLTSDSTNEDILYVRAPRGGTERKNISTLMVLVAGIVGSIAALVLAAVMLMILRKKRKKRKDVDEEDVFPVLNLKVFSYKELHTVTRGFSEKLGHGGFGAVFQGELSDSTLVAVKRLERPGSGEREFRAEVCTIGNIQHVNLVRLRGFCSENSHRLLVYDYMPNGALSLYLRKDGLNLNWDVRFRIAVGTARGIAYLHEECRDCIIHCDIKPENILLDSDYTAKVSDFGLAKLIGRDFSRVLATMRGTWGYVAPEWISGLAITTKADVYSYGMTLLELIGGRRNVEAPASGRNANIGGGGEHGDKWFFPPWAARQIIEGNVAAVVDDRLGGAYKVEEAERVALVAIWCIQDNEEMRPTMGTVVKMLEGVLEVTAPPPPRLIQALVSGESYHGVRKDSSNGVGTGGDGSGDIGESRGGSHSSFGNVSSPMNENANVSIEKFAEETEKDNSSSKTEALTAGDERSSSAPESPTSKSKPVLIDGVSIFETAELHHAPTTLIESREEDYPAIQNFRDATYICCVESSKVWGIAGPIAFNILCNYGINSFTNIFVGHIGDIELSAVAISLSVIANFSFGFLLGMASALETLCGQAFGAGQVELLGVYMQRSILILFVTCIFLLPLYIFATPILKLLGQRDDIAEFAGTFAIQVIPQMFSLAFNFPSQKFLQAQSKVGVLAWIGLAAFVVHIGMLYFFIHMLNWGTAGAAAAYNISALGISIGQMIYVVRYCKDGWKGLSWLAFKDIWGFVRLSIASAIMLCLEIWYFMTIIVLTGHLEDPVIAVGSLSICMNINGWEGMLFLGINAAISVRVSNELGSSHPRAAKYSVIITTTQSLFIGIFCAIVILVTKDDFSIIFTDSEEMRKAVADLASLLGITMLLNSVQPVISGVAVGGGWQALVAYINLFCYYVVGLPFGFLLGYKLKFGVQGIWIGMICGTLLQTLILLYIVYKTNWNKEVEQASERMRKWGAGQDRRSDSDTT